jgi:LysR family transcriptional regulator, transcriptional activator of nhaA
MSAPFNYKHLYYFWVVAKEGGISRAADKLDMAVQTVSAQVRALEQSLGYALLKPAGRGLVLTEAGLAAMQQADQIFQLGENLPALVRDAVSAPTVRLAVGISDGLPKLVVRRLLQPVISEPNLRLLCHEGEFDELLGDLALHRLDLVFSDRAAPTEVAPIV